MIDIPLYFPCVLHTAGVLHHPSYPVNKIFNYPVWLCTLSTWLVSRLHHIQTISLFDDNILFLKPGGILSTILCFISQVCRFNLEENDLIQWGQIRQTVYLFWLVGYTIFRFYHSLMVIICFSRLASSKKCCSPLPMSAENGWCFTLSQITLLKRKEIKQPVHYADCLPDWIVDYNVIQIFLFSGYKLFLKTWVIHSTVSGS